MATDGGTISEDGKTVTYTVDIRLTGTATIADQPCERCGCVVLRSTGILTLGEASGTPVVIERCVQLDCGTPRGEYPQA